MEQTNQSAPANPSTSAPAPATPPQKKPVWVWILGGCLGITVLTMIAIGGLSWWAARKVKEELRENGPKLEEWGKDAKKMQEQAEKWRQEMEKIQKQIPENPASPGASPE